MKVDTRCERIIIHGINATLFDDVFYFVAFERHNRQHLHCTPRPQTLALLFLASMNGERKCFVELRQRSGTASATSWCRLHRNEMWNEHTKLEAWMACIAITSVSFRTDRHIAYAIRWTGVGNGGEVVWRQIYIEVNLLWICRCQISGHNILLVHVTTTLLLVKLSSRAHTTNKFHHELNEVHGICSE